MLNYNSLGDANGVPLLIAHGLFGSARNWGAVARRLSSERRVVVVDMRNHGTSPHFSSNTYDDMAGDLADVIAPLGTKADVLGHSMGGKAAMVLALRQPGLVRNLIVADIAPVAYYHSQMPMINAMQSLDLSAISSRREADAALARQIADPGVRAFLLQSLNLHGERPEWNLNLGQLAFDMDRICGFPDLSGSFGGRTLFLTGSQSDYVLPGYHPRIMSLFPNAEFREIAGAGHWLHADRPREFERELQHFLNR